MHLRLEKEAGSHALSSMAIGRGYSKNSIGKFTPIISRASWDVLALKEKLANFLSLIFFQRPCQDVHGTSRVVCPLCVGSWFLPFKKLPTFYLFDYSPFQNDTFFFNDSILKSLRIFSLLPLCFPHQQEFLGTCLCSKGTRGRYICPPAISWDPKENKLFLCLSAVLNSHRPH